MITITGHVQNTHDLMVKQGFWDKFNKISTLSIDDEMKDYLRDACINQFLALVTTEISEAVESLRKGKVCTVDLDNDYWLDPDLSTPELEAAWVTEFKSKVKDTVGDEIADAVIRILDLCGGIEINLESHIIAKMHYNKTRAKMHGKRF